MAASLSSRKFSRDDTVRRNRSWLAGSTAQLANGGRIGDTDETHSVVANTLAGALSNLLRSGVRRFHRCSHLAQEHGSARNNPTRRAVQT